MFLKISRHLVAGLHRGSWKKPDNGDDSDQMALSRHCSVFHGIVNKPPGCEAPTVNFVEQLNLNSLDPSPSKIIL